MMPYYAKIEDKIYRFDTWADLENFTGRDRKLFGNMPFYKAIRHSMNNERIINKWAAYFEGWIGKDGKPQKPYRSGNL